MTAEASIPLAGPRNFKVAYPTALARSAGPPAAG